MLVSAALHLIAVILFDDWRSRELEADAFEARLRSVARFEPRRLTAERPITAPRTEMEFRRAKQAAPPVEQTVRIDAPPPPLDIPEAERALRDFDVAARTDTFATDANDDVQEALANLQTQRDESRTESLELLRVQDLAQSGERAVVLLDPAGRRKITGFVNLTRLRLRGAGGGWGGLEALAGFMRNHTDLLVQVRDEVHDLVHDPALLKDPIHFLLEGGGLDLIGDWPLLQLHSDEREFLGRYMRQGGLLFIEGSGRFNAEAVDMLQQVLGGDGAIRPLPREHPVYHSFYTFDNGFPGEDKGRWAHLEQLPPSWNYPAQLEDMGAESAGPLNLNPNQAQLDETQLDQFQPRVGLWGVSLGDTLVAVVSDLSLHTRWLSSLSLDDQLAVDGAPALFTGINLIVHALTRTGSVAKRRALPAWVNRRPQTAPESVSVESLGTLAAQVDPDLYADLDASLALIRAPLGTNLGRGGITVRVDGQHRIDLLRATRHGLLLHNLTPGSHWVEVEYQGETEGLEIHLTGGSVTTATFAVSRLAMLRSVRLEAQQARVPVADWLERFSDLNVEEVFLSLDDDLPMPPQ